MKITVLMENTKGHEQCFYEHGLSLYIETNHHHILFDTGQSEHMIDNANILGIDLKKVDIVILSHGHYDHSGALLAFATINPHAKIYMQKEALIPHFHGERYIGIDERIKDLNLNLLEGNMIIDDELSLFTHVKGRKYYWEGNNHLSKRVNEIDEIDDFNHEHNLVIREGNENILVGGCAHNGIINILDHYNDIYSMPLKAVISGFHLKKSSEYKDEEIEQIKQIGYELNKKDMIFYTGHCTGLLPYEILKEIMNEKLYYIHSGDYFEL